MNKTKTSRIILFALLAVGAGFLTGCDAVLESFYPEFAQEDDYEYTVTVTAVVELDGSYDEGSFGSCPMRIAVVPFEDTMHDGLVSRWDEAQIQTSYEISGETKDYGSHVAMEFTVPRGYRYAVVAWQDLGGSDGPDTVEPAVLLECDSGYSLIEAVIPTVRVDDYTVSQVAFKAVLYPDSRLTTYEIDNLTGSALVKETKEN